MATVPVGSFDANSWGLYNVRSNVLEWCEDDWHQFSDGSPTDGSAWFQGGDATLSFCFGGSWHLQPMQITHAKLPTDGRYNYVGFRLARTLNP